MKVVKFNVVVFFFHFEFIWKSHVRFACLCSEGVRKESLNLGVISSNRLAAKEHAENVRDYFFCNEWKAQNLNECFVRTGTLKASNFGPNENSGPFLKSSVAPLDESCTVKASNFGFHGNFGLFLASSAASVDESCTKNEQNRICRSEFILQLLFSFNDSNLFWKRGPKFPWRPKLGALTVPKLNRTKVCTSNVFLELSFFSPLICQ